MKVSVVQQTGYFDSYAGLMLGHRLQRWPNIKPTLGQCILFGVIIVITLH